MLQCPRTKARTFVRALACSKGTRGQSMDGLMVHDLAGLDGALRSRSMRNATRRWGSLALAARRHRGSGRCTRQRAFLQPPVSFVLGAMLGGAHLGSLPVQAQRGRRASCEPIGLHRRHDVVRLPQLLHQACRAVWSWVCRASTVTTRPAKVEPGGQRANGRESRCSCRGPPPVRG